MEYASIRYLIYVATATLSHQRRADIAYVAVIVDSLSRLANMSNVKTGANDPSAQQKEQSTSEVADVTWSTSILSRTVLGDELFQRVSCMHAAKYGCCPRSCNGCR